MRFLDNQALVSGLLATHGEQLRRFLLARVRNRADVPDIVQEVFLRMLRVPKVESLRSPEAYLFTVARHVAQQHALRELAAPSSAQLSEMLDPPPAPLDPQLDAATQQFAEQIQQALDGLDAKARAVFILHRREGMTPDEIAARLGLSRPMVKKYLLKALIQLRAWRDAVE